MHREPTIDRINIARVIADRIDSLLVAADLNRDGDQDHDTEVAITAALGTLKDIANRLNLSMPEYDLGQAQS